MRKLAWFSGGFGIACLLSCYGVKGFFLAGSCFADPAHSTPLCRRQRQPSTFLWGGGSSNEEGLFVLCSAGDFDVFITGDADDFTERMLVKYSPTPDIELLMVDHYGSKHSTSPELLDALRPELAIISVGYNSYGHPTDEVLSRLADRGTRVLRTDLSGPVTLKVHNGEVFIP